MEVSFTSPALIKPQLLAEFLREELVQYPSTVKPTNLRRTWKNQDEAAQSRKGCDREVDDQMFCTGLTGKPRRRLGWCPRNVCEFHKSQIRALQSSLSRMPLDNN